MSAISIPVAQVRMWVNELSQSAFMIIDEEEQAYVQGVKMMFEMDEPISGEVAHRIHQIWVKFKKFQHDSIGGQ